MDGLLIILWLGLSALVAISGSGKRIGYWGVFFLSIFLSPLIGLIVGLVSAPIQNRPVQKIDQSEVLKKQASKLIANSEYEPAMKLLQQALSINTKNIRVMYDMACCYSLQSKNQDALNILAKAVEVGYSNFELINTDSDLANLRATPDFESFKENNYKLVQNTIPKESNLDKIKKLKDLMDSSAITEEEFESEKKKLLNS